MIFSKFSQQIFLFFGFMSSGHTQETCRNSHGQGPFLFRCRRFRGTVRCISYPHQFCPQCTVCACLKRGSLVKVLNHRNAFIYVTSIPRFDFMASRCCRFFFGVNGTLVFHCPPVVTLIKAIKIAFNLSVATILHHVNISTI